MANRAQIREVLGTRSSSLMERIQTDDYDLQFEVGGDELTARIRSIKKNLVDVLNARSGGAESAPDFGLEDLNDANMSSNDMLRQIALQIRNSITKYEPRVHNVQVHFERSENTNLELAFQVSAQTDIKHKSEHVTIDLVLLGDRRFRAR